MDRLHAMSVMVAAADGGSLSAASRTLGLPLATVSRRVVELERHLGTQLVVRGARGLALTDAGARYVAAARRILDDVGDAERSASGEAIAPTGELVVSATQVFGRTHVLPVVAAFLRAYPDIRVRLRQSDTSVDLVEDHVDVAVRMGVPRDGRLVAVPVGEVRRVLCASDDYLAARGVPASMEDLAAHDCIVMESLGSAGRWDFAHGWLGYAGPVRERIAVNTAEASLEAARQGLGIAQVLSYQLDDAEGSVGVRRVLPDTTSEPLPVHLLYVPRRPLPLKVRAFIDFAAPRLRARLGAGDVRGLGAG